MIKAVLIDIDNTLLDFNLSAEQAIKKGFKQFGLSYSDDVFFTFKKVNDMLWRSIEKRELTREELHLNRWNIIFKRLNCVFDGRVFEKQFLSNLDECACKIDGADDIMRYLSEKYRVFTASNAPSEQQIKRLKISGLIEYIEKPFISQKIGYDKPDARFFEECFKNMQPLLKEEAILIGDSYSADICGGHDYGLKTIWFDFEKKGKSDKGVADYKIEKLSEIKRIL